MQARPRSGHQGERFIGLSCEAFFEPLGDFDYEEPDFVRCFLGVSHDGGTLVELAVDTFDPVESGFYDRVGCFLQQPTLLTRPANNAFSVQRCFGFEGFTVIGCKLPASGR